MKRIDWRFLAGSKLRAGAGSRAGFLALAVLGATALHAAPSTPPKYGGILRVQITERVGPIDPRQWPSTPAQAAAVEQVEGLIFERLVRLDERGVLQPALATSWQYDAKEKHWQFRLRGGVKFSDGTPLTPTVAAMALQQLLGAAFDVSANPDSVLIRTERLPMDLPEQLATGRYFIFHAGDDGALAGTGPFRFRLVMAVGVVTVMYFDANESCWAGRPFVDTIMLRTGMNGDQQADAIAFGEAEIVELPPSQVRRAAQRGIRTVSSDPAELFALVSDSSRPAIQDSRERQAVSLAIDRGSIADVVLQHQGIPAGSLLPNWISGYAHLFPVSFDPARAKDLLAGSARESSRSAPLVLTYDSGDAEAKAVADRVAVNAREAGIAIQVREPTADGKLKPQPADMRLLRLRIGSPDAGAALAGLLHAVGEPVASMDTLDQVYAAERGAIDGYRVIPLVHVSESYGLSPRVRDWMAPRWGGWRLEDVWLDQPAPPGENQK